MFTILLTGLILPIIVGIIIGLTIIEIIKFVFNRKSEENSYFIEIQTEDKKYKNWISIHRTTAYEAIEAAEKKVREKTYNEGNGRWFISKITKL